VPLFAQSPGHRDAYRHHARVVRLHDLERGGRVVGRNVCMAEHTEGDNDDVEVTDDRERVVDELRVTREIGRVERDGLDPRRARRAQLSRGTFETLRLAPREDDRPGAVTDQLVSDGDPEVGTASEHEQRLHGTNRVLHAALPSGTRARRRLRSLRMTPIGSTEARTSRHRSIPGYIAAMSSGRTRESFDR
jgi:hypothetical protein